MAKKEYFPNIGKIKFEGTSSYNPSPTATMTPRKSCSANP